MKDSSDNSEDIEVFVPSRLNNSSGQSAGLNKLLFANLTGIMILILLGLLLFSRVIVLKTTPDNAQIEHASGLSVIVGQRLIGFDGLHTVMASAPGYIEDKTEIQFNSAIPDTISIALNKQPGQAVFDLPGIKSATLFINEELIVDAAPYSASLKEGSYTYRITHPLYLSASGTIDIEGRGEEQVYTIDLVPNWRTVELSSTPDGAAVMNGDIELGYTPLTVDLQPDVYVLTYRKKGYQVEKQLLEIDRGPKIEAEKITLKPAAAMIEVNSNPASSMVFIDGEYIGVSPVSLGVDTSKRLKIEVTKEGYDSWQGFIPASSSNTRVVNAVLTRQFGHVSVSSTPTAEIFIDGKMRGETPLRIKLPVENYEFRFEREGYRSVTRQVLLYKGDTSTIEVALKTIEEARISEAQETYVSDGGQTMILARPGPFKMGAPRGEKGQQANEVEKRIDLKRWFYMSDSEVTRRQFSAFVKANPGINEFEKMGPSLKAEPNKPVTNLTWNTAALYCNWLSKQEGLGLFYSVSGGQVTGFDPNSIGYRLPTEAEWAWSARVAGGSAESLNKYPWGSSSTVPKNAGNFADESSSASLPHRIPNYNDGSKQLAPVKSYQANAMGIYDLGGNASEWVHDQYSISIPRAGEVTVDPTGPRLGAGRVVRGSSWKSGSERDIRLSFRTYSNRAEPHIGFRIGRWVN